MELISKSKRDEEEKPRSTMVLLSQCLTLIVCYCEQALFGKIPGGGGSRNIKHKSGAQPSEAERVVQEVGKGKQEAMNHM